MYGWNWFLLVLGFCPSMWLACPYLGRKLVSSRDLLSSSILTRIAEYDLPFFVNFYMNRLLLRLESCFTLFSDNFTQWMIKCFITKFAQFRMFLALIVLFKNILTVDAVIVNWLIIVSNCQVTYNCLPQFSAASPALRLRGHWTNLLYLDRLRPRLESCFTLFLR